MKNITEYLLEKLECEEEECKRKECEEEEEAVKSIKSADDFKSYAENKFKEVFGDDLDKDEMKKVIDGLIEQQKKDGLDWGEVVGMLNKSFAK